MKNKVFNIFVITNIAALALLVLNTLFVSTLVFAAAFAALLMSFFDMVTYLTRNQDEEKHVAIAVSFMVLDIFAMAALVLTF